MSATPKQELPTPLPESSLKELCAASAARDFCVVGLTEGGFGVTAACGSSDQGTQRILSTSRGGIRRFAAIDTAAGFLRELGVQRFTVDLTQHVPGRVRGPRPDRSEALRRAWTSPKQSSLL